MASRPRLKPYFRPLRRGPGAVQLGLSARSGGVVLTGLSSPEIAFLVRLDGTLTETELRDDATRRGIPSERGAVLLALLREHQLLDGDLDDGGPDRVDLGRLPGAAPPLGVDDAPILALPGPRVTLTSPGGPQAPLPREPIACPAPTILGVRRVVTGETGGVGAAGVVNEANEFIEAAGGGGVAGAPQPGSPRVPPVGGASGTQQLLQRTARRVVVSGSGRLPWAIGSLLRTTGVGRVDLGPAALHALDQRLRADPGSTDPGSTDPGSKDPGSKDPGSSPPDLVVLVASGVLDPRAGDPWWRRGVPTLPVVTDGRRIVVGPVVDDPAGPCLHCLDLERADRDGAWPALVAQLSARSRSRGSGVDDEVSSESTLSAMASGVVAMVVTAHLAGDPPPPGVSVEMSLPWPRLDHRRWARHPHCDAHARARHTGGSAVGVAPVSSVGAG